MALLHAKKYHSSHLHVSDAGARAVARFEGFRSRPYRDAVGVWTIGYGHTENVNAHTRPWSRKQARLALRHELDTKYAPAVRALNVELTQNQFDALVSFVYNLGPGAIGVTTTIGRELRSRRKGHWRRAANAMLDWNKAGGHVLAGLTSRRRAERRRFLRRL